ncbi:hypothetical protein [Parabacteroides sp.]|uniref:hypothetical protein n=1 Tax=Parabacteroides sp. TaxID=1869337 RepID=UPI00257D6893|nr:hypothetical protein [Parabacteroides sp.]
MAKIPKTAYSSSPGSQAKQAKSVLLSYQDQLVCWQIGQFDINGRWGLESALGDVTFQVSEELFILLNNYGDNSLYEALDKISGKKTVSFSDFYKKLKDNFNGKIPVDIVHQISLDVSRAFFLSKIYPKLRDFETKTWKEIERETTGKNGRSKHHSIDIKDLCEEAQERLVELKLDDLDSLFSLRLDGTLRIFGIRNQNYLRILWVDQDHKICPSQKKNT